MIKENKILLKVEEAGISFNNKSLVSGVSLQVRKGEIVTLIGPNGSGKSTTAKIALGIYKNIEGKVQKFTDKIGYVPQKISIDWTLPIRVIEGWQDASETFNVTLELVKRGYTEKEIAQIWSGNLLRVLNQTQKIANNLQNRN